MYCTKCGTESPNGTVFCANCGKRFVQNNTLGEENHKKVFQSAIFAGSNLNQKESPVGKGTNPIINNVKWPVPVIVLSASSFILYLITVIAFRSLEITLTCIYYFLSAALLSFILFLVTKKPKPQLTIIPIWIMALGNLLGYLFYQIPYNHFFFISLPLLFLFAILYSVLTFVEKSRSVALFTVLIILGIAITSLTFFYYPSTLHTNNLYSSDGPYVIILMVSLAAFLAAHNVAAFSLLPKKEKKLKLVYAEQDNRLPTISKFCTACGIQYTDDKKFCDQCGGELKEITATVVPNPLTAVTPQQNPLDAPSGGFAALGFFFPVIGFILYLVWKDNYPLRARSTGKGALIGFITSVALSIILTVVYIIILKSTFPF